MMIHPAHQTPKPAALVTPGYHCIRVQTATEDTSVQGPARVHAALDALRGHVVYARGLMHLLHTTGATTWQVSAWKGRATSMTLDGTRTRVLSLRDAMGSTTADEQIAALLTVHTWLAGYGVRMGSLSSMAWRLWQSTLDADVSMASLPALGQAAFYGPRQEVREPRRYRHMAIVDLSNAYPTAMAARPYALTLREVHHDTHRDPARSGLARATVRIPPDLPFAPLPVRVADGVIQWRSGSLGGIWTWGELDAAQALACTVDVERCYAPMDEGQPFGRWHGLVTEGRALEGAAGRFVKAIGNALWGMFAMAGDHKATVRFTDDAGEHPIVVARPARALPQASTAHIAAETAARVRTQTLAEVYKMSAYPVHIDTDGVIVRRSAARPYPTTAGPGEFRRKTVLRTVELRAPQLYRYQCDEDCCVLDSGPAGNWHYVAAGMSTSAAQALFTRATPSRVSVLSVDTVLPPMHGYEAARLEPYLKEAQGLRMALFGPSLDR
jgi:hypothetical protein